MFDNRVAKFLSNKAQLEIRLQGCHAYEVGQITSEINKLETYIKMQLKKN